MRTRLLLPLALAGAVALPALAATVEDVLKPADHASLGKKIAEYFDAKQKNAGIDKAKEQLSKEMEGLKKKAKNRDPLALCADLSKALWQAFEYGTRVGVWRCLSIFERFEVRLSLLGVVQALLRNPEVTAACVSEIRKPLASVFTS